MTAPQPAVPAGQLIAVLAWAARLTAAGPGAGAAETAAYLTAKAAVLERIAAAGRQAGGWTPADIAAGRRRHHRHERGLRP